MVFFVADFAIESVNGDLMYILLWLYSGYPRYISKKSYQGWS
jgi:hypothetical protein